MKKINYKIKSFEKFNICFQDYIKKIAIFNKEEIFENNHNDEYLKICCWNLYEKYIRGQSGFTNKAINFIKKNIGV